MVVVVVSTYCLIGSNRISMHQKRMHTSDVPSSSTNSRTEAVLVVSYCLLARGIEQKFSHRSTVQFMWLWLFHIVWFAGGIESAACTCSRRGCTYMHPWFTKQWYFPLPLYAICYLQKFTTTTISLQIQPCWSVLLLLHSTFLTAPKMLIFSFSIIMFCIICLAT